MTPTKIISSVLMGDLANDVGTFLLVGDFIFWTLREIKAKISYNRVLFIVILCIHTRQGYEPTQLPA